MNSINVPWKYVLLKCTEYNRLICMCFNHSNLFMGCLKYEVWLLSDAFRLHDCPFLTYLCDSASVSSWVFFSRLHPQPLGHAQNMSHIFRRNFTAHCLGRALQIPPVSCTQKATPLYLYERTRPKECPHLSASTFYTRLICSFIMSTVF